MTEVKKPGEEKEEKEEEQKEESKDTDAKEETKEAGCENEKEEEVKGEGEAQTFPLGSKRPWDEFYDMSTIKPIRIENVVEGCDSIQILTEVEGTGYPINDDDTVYYKHETRFDNGQLVDLNETRKVADKFIMSDPRYLDFLRSAFLKMRKGQAGFIKIGEL